MALELKAAPEGLMSDAELAVWHDIPPAIISDELNRTGAMTAAIKPLAPGMKVVGQALTVQTMVGDNAALHYCLTVAWPGATSIDAGLRLNTDVLSGNITFNGTVDGTQDLSLNTNLFGFQNVNDGNIFFNDDVGASTILGALSVNEVNNFTLADGKVMMVGSFELIFGAQLAKFGAKNGSFDTGLITSGNDGTISIQSFGFGVPVAISGTIVNTSATAAGTVFLAGRTDATVNIGALNAQFGVLTIGSFGSSGPPPTYRFTNSELRGFDDLLKGASTIENLFGRTCSFNTFDCTSNNELLFDFFESLPTGPFTPPFPASKTGTDSLDNTPAQAAFNDDPLEGEFAVDVFGTEFELVETAGGAEAAYTGLNYVFQDFWEFLAEGEGGEGEAEGEADEGADECDEDEELVGGECV